MTDQQQEQTPQPVAIQWEERRYASSTGARVIERELIKPTLNGVPIPVIGPPDFIRFVGVTTFINPQNGIPLGEVQFPIPGVESVSDALGQYANAKVAWEQIMRERAAQKKIVTANAYPGGMNGARKNFLGRM